MLQATAVKMRLKRVQREVESEPVLVPDDPLPSTLCVCPGYERTLTSADLDEITICHDASLKMTIK